MLRDNLVGLIEPMRISAGVDPPALIQKQSSDDRSSCLENPRPEGAESSLTENVTSPFQAEPAQLFLWTRPAPLTWRQWKISERLPTPLSQKSFVELTRSGLKMSRPIRAV